jgi:hypothetical protein
VVVTVGVAEVLQGPLRDSRLRQPVPQVRRSARDQWLRGSPQAAHTPEFMA